MRKLWLCVFLMGCGSDGGSARDASLDAYVYPDASPDAGSSCAACGPGTVCVQTLSNFSGCGPQASESVHCAVTSLVCPPHSCSQACQNQLCPIWYHGLPDGGVVSYREDCTPQCSAAELPGAFLCYHGE
jgi:hypothetical protein